MLKGRDVEEVKRSKEYEDLIIVLGISLHNLGSEYEHFGSSDEALSSYEKCVQVLNEHLGDQHKLTVKFKKHLVLFLEV